MSIAPAVANVSLGKVVAMHRYSGIAAPGYAFKSPPFASEKGG